MNPVYARLIVYAISPLLGLIPAVNTPYFAMDVVDGWVHMSIMPEAIIMMLLSAFTVSGVTFKLWGKS